MPRPVFLILCESALTEAGTNILSVVRMIERVTIDEPGLEAKIADAELPKNKVAIVRYQMSLAAWFVRSDYQTAESWQGRFGFNMPDGQFWRAGEARLDFSSSTGVRVVAQLPGFPWGGYGLYWFVAQIRASDEDDWTEIAAFPLEVVDGTRADEKRSD